MSHCRAFSRFTWRSTTASWTTHWVQKSLLILALLSAAIGFQIHFSGAALAYGVCAPSSQTTKLQYTNAGCIFSDTAWFSQTPGDYAHIRVSFDSSVPTKLVNDFQIGANSWTNNGGHVDFTFGSSCSNCGSNLVTVSAVNTNPCQGWWGQGNWKTPHTVVLNLCHLGGSDGGWQETVAHELGHTMGLAHNRWNNGGALMFGCDFPGQFSDCIIHVPTPQAVDVDILNTIFPDYSALCSLVPNDENCDNQDYQVQSCNAYAQTPVAQNAYISVTLYYSTNCQSNWTWAKILGGGYVLYQVDIERAGNNVDPAMTLTDYPGTSTWYTNMIWAPQNSARSCAWYASPDYGRVFGPVCTSWH